MIEQKENNFDYASHVYSRSPAEMYEYGGEDLCFEGNELRPDEITSQDCFYVASCHSAADKREQAGLVNTGITTADAFEEAVYAQFPASLHAHVEHELFYHSEELQAGEMTMQQFIQGVVHTARDQEIMDQQRAEAAEIFHGVQVLIDEGVFGDLSVVDELKSELAEGQESLLANFIYLQPVKDPLDAAVSFLAWKHMKAIVSLEDKFGICLDNVRNEKDPEAFCTSESGLARINFSVMCP